VSPRQPVVSGERLIKALRKEGWEVVRQRGSHVRLKKAERKHALVVRSTGNFVAAPSLASCATPISAPRTCGVS
jgi:predicted RNA binding protein YcfA (HicA-like mRNA interferase family)